MGIAGAINNWWAVYVEYPKLMIHGYSLTSSDSVIRLRLFFPIIFIPSSLYPPSLHRQHLLFLSILTPSIFFIFENLCCRFYINVTLPPILISAFFKSEQVGEGWRESGVLRWDRPNGMRWFPLLFDLFLPLSALACPVPCLHMSVHPFADSFSLHLSKRTFMLSAQPLPNPTIISPASAVSVCPFLQSVGRVESSLTIPAHLNKSFERSANRMLNLVSFFVVVFWFWLSSIDQRWLLLTIIWVTSQSRDSKLNIPGRGTWDSPY